MTSWAKFTPGSKSSISIVQVAGEETANVFFVHMQQTVMKTFTLRTDDTDEQNEGERREKRGQDSTNKLRAEESRQTEGTVVEEREEEEERRIKQSRVMHLE